MLRVKQNKENHLKSVVQYLKCPYRDTNCLFL